MNKAEFKRSMARYFAERITESQAESYGGLIYRRLVERYIKCNSKSGLVLDIGCGTGSLQKLLPSVGVDISLERLRTASNNRESQFVQADAEHLPFRDKVFDWAHLAATLMHIPNYHRALTEIVRVCNLEGKLFLFEPNWDYLPNRLKRTKAIRVKPVWMQSFSERDLGRTLKELGFSLLRSRTCLYKIPLLQPFLEKSGLRLLLFLERFRMPFIGREILIIAQRRRYL